jgi:putative FmdB family regulatory protein
MPNYDFKCDTCSGSIVEMHLAFDALERPACDVCGNPMSKVFTPPAVQFKGGGWGGDHVQS